MKEFQSFRPCFVKQANTKLKQSMTRWSNYAFKTFALPEFSSNIVVISPLPQYLLSLDHIIVVGMLHTHTSNCYAHECCCELKQPFTYISFSLFLYFYLTSEGNFFKNTEKLSLSYQNPNPFSWCDLLCEYFCLVLQGGGNSSPHSVWHGADSNHQLGSHACYHWTILATFRLQINFDFWQPRGNWSFSYRCNMRCTNTVA